MRRRLLIACVKTQSDCPAPEAPTGPKAPQETERCELHDQVVKEAIQDRLNKELDSKPVDVNDIGGEWHKFSNTAYI